jgi:hypothetical protein
MSLRMTEVEAKMQGLSLESAHGGMVQLASYVP